MSIMKLQWYPIHKKRNKKRLLSSPEIGCYDCNYIFTAETEEIEKL